MAQTRVFTPGSAGERFAALDGIRGWAALSVVLFHIFWECFGERFPILRNLWTASLINGPFAVCLFFIVSGAALSAPFYARPERITVLASALKRYPRLMLPIAATTLLAFVLHKLGLMHGHEAAHVLGRADWVGLDNPALLTPRTSVLFATSLVFSGHGPAYDILPFLWTMPIEMVGSIALFVYLACCDQVARKDRLLLALGAAVFVPYPYLSCFFLGSWLCLLKGQGRRIGALHHWLVRAFALGIAITFVATSETHHLPAEEHLQVLVAFVLCYYAVNVPAAAAFFSNRVSAFLGRLSFPIYLVHYLVLATVLAPLAVRHADHLTLTLALQIGALAFAVSVLAAVAFLPVESAAHRWSKWVAASALDLGGRQPAASLATGTSATPER